MWQRCKNTLTIDKECPSVDQLTFYSPQNQVLATRPSSSWTCGPSCAGTAPPVVGGAPLRALISCAKTHRADWLPRGSAATWSGHRPLSHEMLSLRPGVSSWATKEKGSILLLLFLGLGWTQPRNVSLVLIGRMAQQWWPNVREGMDNKYRKRTVVNWWPSPGTCLKIDRIQISVAQGIGRRRRLTILMLVARVKVSGRSRYRYFQAGFDTHCFLSYEIDYGRRLIGFDYRVRTQEVLFIPQTLRNDLFLLTLV